MQLHFTSQEFNVLADILLNRDVSGVLLDQVLARHLRLSCEELDQLRAIVEKYSGELRSEIATCTDSLLRITLQDRSRQLDGILDKVNEACAMI
jgi:ABC-type phosphate transport system auxiliary subunit